ncbi:hypothetical protein HY485_01115 [Candidatus Woesearchaeota archaeon]|nr:hypothetical protein [Candidatus Woesearchaeota archaeon]
MAQQQTVRKDAWLRHFYQKALNDYLDQDPLARQYNSANWIFGRQVRIARADGVNEAVVDPVARGIQDLLNDIGLDFSIVDVGVDAQANRLIRYATKSDGRIDTDVLTQSIIACGGRDFASVVLTPNYFTASDQDWGEGRFSRGTLLLALPHGRQNSLNFLRNITKHEAAHLFGYQLHHETVTVPEYKQPKDCVMYWQASTQDLCDKCKDALKAFWHGIENNSGERFLKE